MMMAEKLSETLDTNFIFTPINGGADFFLLSHPHTKWKIKTGESVE
jgi:hypothetical protein